MTDEEFADRMKETKNTLEELKEELNKLGVNQSEKIDSDTARRIINDIKNKWSLLSPLEKKQFMNLFIKNIQLKKINEKNTVVNITFY
jgi:predicted nuclease with TOPRIM domain